MSDLEYDVLDELYFITHYNDLLDTLGLSDDEICSVLVKLSEKQWINCFLEPNIQVLPEDVDLEIDFRKYFYLASKKGLRAHNGFE